MTQYLDTALRVIASVLLIASLIYLLRGMRFRAGMRAQTYAVGRQESRLGMMGSLARGGFLLVLSLITFGVLGLIPGTDTSLIDPSPTAQSTPSLLTTAVATTPIPPPLTQEAGVSPTSPVVRPSQTPTETPAPTETSAVPFGVVNSPNGLWLRESPGGNQQLELIADGTELTLLPGVESAADLEWQQVRTPAGNEGWVAADFIDYR